METEVANFTWNFVTFEKNFWLSYCYLRTYMSEGIVILKSLYNSNNLQNIKRYAAQQILTVSWNAWSRSMQNSYS